MTAKEHRSGPLNNQSDFLKDLQKLVLDFNALVRLFNQHVAEPLTFLQIIDKPTTLSGYGIVDAAPLVHRHDWSEIDGAPDPGTGIVTWSSITGKPFTIDGFGIVDASKIGHKHAYADILDPPPPGVGPPGPSGPAGMGLPGAMGPVGLGIPGLDGQAADEPLMIPGKDGRQGVDGRTLPPIPWVELAPPAEPLMIPGQRGIQGPVGAAGAGGGGAASHEGVLAFGLPEAPEPFMAAGIPGSTGKDGPGFYYQGVWDAGQAYLNFDVVLYQGSLWYADKFGTSIGDVPGVDIDWLLFLPAGLQGPRGYSVPSLEIAPPIEPLMIPGPRGPQGAGGGGGGGADLIPLELNFGLVPVAGKRFLIVDALAIAGSQVQVSPSGAVPAGEALTNFDEFDMDPLVFSTQVLPAGGSYYLNARCQEPRGKIIGKRVVNTLIG